MNDYIEILREWERKVANPAIYDSLDLLFPKYNFRRIHVGTERDHWISKYKIDLSDAKRFNPEKTVVYRTDFRFREQGDWDNPVSIINNYMLIEGLTSVYDAYVSISNILNLEMPKPSSKEIAVEISKSKRRESIIEDLNDYFLYHLLNGSYASKVRTYLKKRGFRKEDFRNLGFGFVPEWGRVVRHMTVTKKYSYEEIEDACGVINSEGKTLVGKTYVLSILYKCGPEKKGFIFRRLDNNMQPKYLACKNLDRKSIFFNMPEELNSSSLVLVEGEIDALKATAEHVPNVVAIGGAYIASERKQMIEYAFRRGVDRIYLCLDLDLDADGQPNYSKRRHAIKQCIHTIQEVNIDFDSIYVTVFPEPCDPDSYITKYGVNEFVSLLRNSLRYWDYLALK